MKKLLASALAVSMVAGMAISASAADIKNLKLAGNLVNDNDLKDAYAVDYASVSNRDSYELPDNWGNDGYESDKIAPVLVYGDTKEYNILVYNLNDSVDVHVNSGKVRVSTRKYAAEEADHDGNIYPNAVSMGAGYYSAVDQFGVPYSYVTKVSIPDGAASATPDQYATDIKTVWYTLNARQDGNGRTDNTGDTTGTVVVEDVPTVTLPDPADVPAPTSVKSKDTTLATWDKDHANNAYEAVYTTNKDHFDVTATTIVGGTTFSLITAPESAAPTAAYITRKPGAQEAKAYFGTKKENGKYYLIASKQYMYYELVSGEIVQTIVSKGQYIDTKGIPVDAADKVEAAQYAYDNGLDDTTLGGGTTIERGTNAVVLTIKSNHGPRDVKVEDFKIEVDVKDGNTFFIEGASGYSNIRDVVDDDRLTNQEDDDKGCVYNFGEKIYETARIRCTDFVDLYFNGNYDTNKENLRVSTDEISEIKNYFEDYDIDFVNFIARPKFATPVTVIIDADKNSYIYEYNESTGDVTLMNDDKATYDSTDGWKFKDNTLGIYLVFEEEYENANVKADKSAPVEEPEEPEEPSASEAPSTSTEKPNPGTGANDMVGAAAALAVVSLVAAGAVAFKKLSK